MADFERKQNGGDPVVSVVLPTYNRAAYLKRAIRSVLCQSFDDFELIIVDDDSDDGTEEVALDYKDNRIRYVRLKERVGASEARNIGVRYSRGVLVAFQDSDDEWSCEKLEACVRALELAPDCVGVFSGYIQVNRVRVRYMPIALPPSDPTKMARALLFGNFVGTPTAVVRKETLEAVGGFDRNLPQMEDWDLFIRIAVCGRLLFIEEPLIVAHCTPGSLNTSLMARRKAASLIYKKNKRMIESDRLLRVHWLRMMGDLSMRAGERKGGRGLLFRAFVMNPWNIRLAGLLVLALMFGRHYAKVKSWFANQSLQESE